MPNNSFPTLSIDPGNIYGSWKDFLNQFTVALQFEVFYKGTKTIKVEGQDTEVEIFTEKMKAFALLRSVGKEGHQALEAQGIEITDPNITYEAVLNALKANYEREESLNVKLWNFSSAQQQTGEQPRDFLRRVEHLSRTTGVFKSTEGGLDPGKTKAANDCAERIRKTIAQITVV